MHTMINIPNYANVGQLTITRINYSHSTKIFLRELTLRYSLISVVGDRVKRCNVWFIFTLAELPGIAPG